MEGTSSFAGGLAPGRSVCFVFLAFIEPQVRLGGIVIRINEKVVVLMILEVVSIRESRLRVSIDCFYGKSIFNHDFFWIM
jgi:hypothetical protein